MNQINNKRAHIVSVSIVEVHQAIISNFIAVDFINVNASWTKLNMTDISFEENDVQNGAFTIQSFSGKITTFTENMERELKSFCSQLLLFKLDYSNGISKIIGTDQYPVEPTLKSGGEYHSYLLSFKRKSPQASKILK